MPHPPPSPPSPPARPPRPPGCGLSARLLALTVLFVMSAEVLIYVPSLSYRRIVFLDQRLAQSHLALLGVEAAPDGMVDADLQRRLLAQAGVLGVTADRPGRPPLILGPDRPAQTVAATWDLNHYPVWARVGDVLALLVRDAPRVVTVRGVSPHDPTVALAVVLSEEPMRRDLLAYSGRILGLSLAISAITAALLFLALDRLLVRPVRRLTAAMERFRADPLDPARILRPGRRGDELGAAEAALADLQTSLRDALAHQARLAGVGTGVAKIAHDLKGILTTALLETDRLTDRARGTGPNTPPARHGDEPGAPDGLVEALERAVALCTGTLRFATEGPPHPQPSRVALDRLVAGLAGRLAARHPRVTWDLAGLAGVTVVADPGHLERLFGNLMNNAAQAGARRITLAGDPPLESPGDPDRSCTLASGTGPWVVVAVGDDGPGLPPKALAHLFQPFSGSARVGGTGLGLPIAHDLARAQGGRLTLAASGPQGTTFLVCLPSAAPPYGLRGKST